MDVGLTELAPPGKIRLGVGYRIGRLIRRTAFHLVWSVWKHTYQRSEVHGVIVYLSVGNEPVVRFDRAVASLAAAITCLKTRDLRRYRQIERYVRHVVIWEGEYTAYDWGGGCHFALDDLDFNSELPDNGIDPSELIAAALVHEATHLRIEARGIPYHPLLRERIERLCSREEADYVRRIPEYGEAAAAILLEPPDKPNWTPEARFAQCQRVAQKHGLPNSVAKFNFWLRGP